VNVRIISGIYGGRKIAAPDNDRTHPMSERVRNAMFNSIGLKIKGARVLDAFAGTGSIGIEALSRGAVHATFVERDRVAQDVLVENLTLLGATPEASVVKTSVANWVHTVQNAQFDVIFADPPYRDEQFSTVSMLFGLLKAGGLMVLSHPGRGEVPTKTGVVVVDNRSYGNAYLTFYRREDA
jgi:16S rRNA (guanine966-N2)-methyltransferase